MSGTLLCNSQTNGPRRFQDPFVDRGVPRSLDRNMVRRGTEDKRVPRPHRRVDYVLTEIESADLQNQKTPGNINFRRSFDGCGGAGFEPETFMLPT